MIPSNPQIIEVNPVEMMGIKKIDERVMRIKVILCRVDLFFSIYLIHYPDSDSC